MNFYRFAMPRASCLAVLACLLCNIRKTAWSAAILALSCTLSVAQAGQPVHQAQGQPDPAKRLLDKSCPKPKVFDNRYTRKMNELAAQNVPINDPRWVAASTHFDNYGSCATEIGIAAASGYAIFTMNESSVKDSLPNLVIPLEEAKNRYKKGFDIYPELQEQAFVMAYHGTPTMETTHIFFCKCLSQHLDDGLSAALGEEPDGD